MLRILNFFRKKRLAKKLSKIINDWTRLLSIFQDINISEIDFQYANKLRGYENYEKLITTFDKKVFEIQQHNKTISELTSQFNDIIKAHPRKYILLNIDKYSLSQIQVLNEVALHINQYTLPDNFLLKESYLRYMKDIGELVSDYSSLVEQYTLIKDFEAISFSFGDIYIDAEMSLDVLAPARAIIEKVRAYGSKYYLIPRLDEKIIERHNEGFIKKHINDNLFDDINGKSLDKEQRRAILCDAKSNLTIAGAGAGKTLTICGKVKWLLETGKANKDEILLLSYSKASADDLAAKIEQVKEGLTVKTFHSFGLEILNHVYGSKRAIEEQFKAYINKFFEEELPKDNKTANDIFRFYSLYLCSQSVSNKTYSTEGEKFENLKTLDYYTLKDRLKSLSNDIQKLETLQKEYVKSYEELVIANFLYTNGINYEYECSYEIDTSTPDKRQYTPDFYLPDYKIYLEHYGINKNGRAPQYTNEEEQSYLAGIRWKRQTHANNQTICIETYSYEFNEGSIFKNLSKLLEERGVKLRPLSQKEILDALNTIYLNQEFSSLFNLIMTFLNLYKAQYHDANGFEQLQQQTITLHYDVERTSLFLEICKNIYKYYIKSLRAENKIDFDDMILQSIAALDNTEKYRYKYIVVDEFQDISQSRMRLLKKTIEHGKSKLFAVGDDWQAIYRFAGCDISIFLKFEQYFEDAKLNYITSTHRNSADLQAIVEPFITANPEQYKKHIQSSKHQDKPVRIFYHNKNRASAFTKALQNIVKTKPDAEVLVLGRNLHDVDALVSDEIQVENYSILTHLKFPNMALTYKTVHRSKGLESDYVILINGEDDKNGFPNKMEDDRLLDLVLGEKSCYEYAEERRLFYVALTRTRSVVYVLSDKTKPSVFVREIENNVAIDNLELYAQDTAITSSCPWCKSGKLILRNRKTTNKAFYGCSNFPYCKYTINNLVAVKINNRCIDCGDFLVIRQSKYGKFVGCYNYPRCNVTLKINELRNQHK